MRIIAGRWRGTTLLAPPGRQTRPILDQVKESVFNMLGARLASPGTLPACTVLDLFAGTGSLGLEALSRGARACTFFERHAGTAAQLRRNIERLHADALCTVRVVNSWKADLNSTAAAGPFELIFVDPPYRDARVLDSASPVVRLLERLRAADAVAEQAVIILRYPTPTADPPTFEHHDLLERRRYGGMEISFLQPQQ